MEIRRSYDRLISPMGFPILVRLHLYIESGRWWIETPCYSCDIPLIFDLFCSRSLWRWLHQRADAPAPGLGGPHVSTSCDCPLRRLPSLPLVYGRETMESRKTESRERWVPWRKVFSDCDRSGCSYWTEGYVSQGNDRCNTVVTLDDLMIRRWSR